MNKIKIVFASHNKHKIDEIKQILGDRFEITSLTDLGVTEEIPETGNSYFENANIKASYVYNKFGLNCFADDSGIEFSGLLGEPGIFSARWAGENATGEDLVEKSLKLLGDSLNSGFITYQPFGCNGFAYDKIFVPNNCEKTLAEMTNEEKNVISHRGIAVRKLKEFLLNKIC
jgi:XTP/dITP diphosphohydrolase